MRKHSLSAYKDGYKWIPFCVHCSLEGFNALEQEPICVGKYVSPLTKETIKNMENRIDNLKSIF